MERDLNISAKIAQYLLEIKAVKLNPEDPFKWSRGWNSPIYCDNRVSLSHPHIRSYIKAQMSAMIKERFPEVTALCGVATAGIAIGALAAEQLDLPYSYCRPKPKEHGMKNQLEGQMDKNAKVVVVEDLISTGGSSLMVVDYLRKEGYNVLGLASIFTYGFDHAEEAFRSANCDWFSLSDYHSMLPTAVEMNYIKSEQLQALSEWRKDPANWQGV